MIYINGIKASRADVRALLQWLNTKKITATAHTTKSGALAIVTNG